MPIKSENERINLKLTKQNKTISVTHTSYHSHTYDLYKTSLLYSDDMYYHSAVDVHMLPPL